MPNPTQEETIFFIQDIDKPCFVCKVYNQDLLLMKTFPEQENLISEIRIRQPKHLILAHSTDPNWNTQLYRLLNRLSFMQKASTVTILTDPLLAQKELKDLDIGILKYLHRSHATLMENPAKQLGKDVLDVLSHQVRNELSVCLSLMDVSHQEGAPDENFCNMMHERLKQLDNKVKSLIDNLESKL